MVYTILTTPRFDHWLAGVTDDRAVAIVYRRLDRIVAGHLGDFKPLRDGVSEVRIEYGPGYRLYFTRRERTLLLLLGGGIKQSQDRDIAAAIALLKSL